MNNIIEMKKINKTFKMPNFEINVLKNCNCSIKQGTMNAIIGPSGSGKSTILNILGTMDTPTSGEYLFEGKSVIAMSDSQKTKLRAEKIGFIFQNYNLIPTLNVFQNISMPLHINKVEKKDIKNHVKSVLKEVGLEHRFTHVPNELSGGERQRVAIARAIVKKCRLLIADEPTGNLDEKTSEEIVNLLFQINKQYKTTLIVVTHDINLIENFDKVFKICDGVIHEQ